ncbi:MAG: hypothetical protein KC656_27210 [Myxococcales bacterium]|nr:hypothetical protein [Myxococcales bacterium]
MNGVTLIQGYVSTLDEGSAVATLGDSWKVDQVAVGLDLRSENACDTHDAPSLIASLGRVAVGTTVMGVREHAGQHGQLQIQHGQVGELGMRAPGLRVG